MNMKQAIITYILLLFFGVNIGLAEQNPQTSSLQPVVIPDEAIRLRILANSDSPEDQQLKRKVRNAVNAEITKWVKDLTSIEEARNVIRSHLKEIEQIAKEVTRKEKNEQSVKVEFGKVQFPTKFYGQYLYPAGEYEAILITLGEGNGANWWCVLFPPLCFLDFSNSEAVDASKEKKQGDMKIQSVTDEEKNENLLMAEEEEQKVEVKFFIVEWFTALFQ
jgi:stage II sporulation protein R